MIQSYLVYAFFIAWPLNRVKKEVKTGCEFGCETGSLRVHKTEIMIFATFAKD